MGKTKLRSKKSLAQMTLVYLIIASVVIAAVIMTVYIGIYSKEIETDSPLMLDSFEDTYKFMMDKQQETAADVDRDMNVSEQLVSSAINQAGIIIEHSINAPDGCCPVADELVDKVEHFLHVGQLFLGCGCSDAIPDKDQQRLLNLKF